MEESVSGVYIYWSIANISDMLLYGLISDQCFRNFIILLFFSLSSSNTYSSHHDMSFTWGLLYSDIFFPPKTKESPYSLINLIISFLTLAASWTYIIIYYWRFLGSPEIPWIIEDEDAKKKRYIMRRKAGEGQRERDIGSNYIQGIKGGDDNKWECN